MSSLRASLASLVLLLLGSCEYSSNEIYEVEPEASDPASLTLHSNLDTIDPIVLVDSLWFSFEAGITGGILYFVDVYLEDQWLYEQRVNYNPDTLTGPYTLADSFWISAEQAPDSSQVELSIFLYHSANTNSLADILGLEYDVSEHYYELYMEGGLP